MNGLNFLQLYQRVSSAAIWARLAKSAVLWPLCRILTEQLHQPHPSILTEQLHQCQQEAEDGFGWSQLGTQLSARCAALGRRSASKQILNICHKLQALWAWCVSRPACTGSPLFLVLLEDIWKCALPLQEGTWETPALTKMGRSWFS